MAGFAGAGAGAVGEGVAHVFAGLFGEGFETFDDFRIVGGDVLRFADVVAEVVEFVADGERFVFAGEAVLAGRLALHGA